MFCEEFLSDKSDMGVPWRICILVVFLTLIGYCSSQDSTECRMADNCTACISVGPTCGWCAQRDFFNASCDLASTLLMTNCSDIQNPEAYVVNITKNEELSDAGDAPLGQAVQVKPQEIHLKIRRGETATIRMDVRQAEDYPVDMYYLMDLSHSMTEDLDTIRSLAGDLVAKMQELTRNFQVGFGSFVDKNVIPFASLNEDSQVILRCAPLCEDPYLFKNRQTLTNSSELFAQTLSETGISTSQDLPEAGFDALVQVSVCSEVVGWRESARHLVVFLTDAPYHTAGDGRLGGIVTPNDGLCHVDPVTGEYMIEKLQDYPSLGHLSSLVREKDIIMMFVVAAGVQQTYKDILPFFPGSQIGTLAANSANIVFWIENLYNKITSVVTLSVQAPEELLLEFTSHCDIDTSVPGAMTCEGLNIGDIVSFDIDVTAESCIEGGTTSFSVSPVGFSEELLVYVDVICGCDCEKQGVPNSPECNYNGTNQCGMCACNMGRYGDECQCSGESSSVGDDRLACIAPGSLSICSGRGECICGECVCNKQKDPTQVVSGEFCQCDNFNCPLFEGQLCGGPDRGTCVCDPATQQSKCQCTVEYEGDSCNCLRSQEACISPNGLICNAYGSCTCGACRCETDSPFKGPTCVDCATCKGQCDVYQECVQCVAFNSGPLTEEQCDMCTVEVIKVQKFPEVEYPYKCSVNHIDNCTIVFIPHFVNGEDSVPVIYVLDDTVCPRGPVAPRVDAKWVAVGLAIFIVVIGILLIILYKCYITWLDRKEFREWEKEKNDAQFIQNENPLYKAASTVHQNPAYGAKFSDEGEQKVGTKYLPL